MNATKNDAACTASFFMIFETELAESETMMRPLQEMPKWFKRSRFLAELKNRDGDLDGLWPDDPRLLFVRDKLGAIISKAVDCPDHRFIPTDSFSAIYNNFRTCFGYDSMDDIEMMMDIEDAFAIEIPEHFNVTEMSYLDFVRYISEHAGIDLDRQMSEEAAKKSAGESQA